MKLRDSLVEALTLYGPDILTSKRLVNILADLCTYDELNKANRHILSTIIADGLLVGVIENESVDGRIKLPSLKHNLTNNYGYDTHLADYLVNEIEAALEAYQKGTEEQKIDGKNAEIQSKDEGVKTADQLPEVEEEYVEIDPAKLNYMDKDNIDGNNIDGYNIDENNIDENNIDDDSDNENVDEDMDVEKDEVTTNKKNDFIMWLNLIFILSMAILLALL